MSLYYLLISKKEKKEKSEKIRSKIVELRFCYKLGWSLKPTMGRFYTTHFLYTISLTMVQRYLLIKKVESELHFKSYILAISNYILQFQKI